MKLTVPWVWLLVFLCAFATGAQAGFPPQITINTPAAGDVVVGLVSVSGTAADDVGLRSIEIRTGSGPWIPTPASANWSYTWSSYVLAGSQSVTLEARATDTEGQSTSASITLTVRNPKVHIKENGIIAVIGDSIAAGDNPAANWPTELQTLLVDNGRSDVTVINEGEGGLSSKEFWLDAAHEGQKKSDIAAHPTINIAFLMLGHNDIRADDSKWHKNSEAEYRNFMFKTIQWLQTRVNVDGSATQVIVVTPVPAVEPVIRNHWKFPSDFNRRMQGPKGYNGVLFTAIKALNVYGLDTLSEFDGGASKFEQSRKADPALISNDTIHLGTEGYKRLARLALTKLDLSLDQKRSSSTVYPDRHLSMIHTALILANGGYAEIAESSKHLRLRTNHLYVEAYAILTALEISRRIYPLVTAPPS